MHAKNNLTMQFQEILIMFEKMFFSRKELMLHFWSEGKNRHGLLPKY